MKPYLLALTLLPLSGCGIMLGAVNPSLADNKAVSLLLPHAKLGAKMTKEKEPDSYVYEATRDARIRLYHKNSAGSAAFADASCSKKKKHRYVEVGLGLGDQFRSISDRNKNISLGIPETEYSRKTMSAKQLFGHRFFREWAVEGGKPVTLLVGDLKPGSRLESGGYVTTTKDISCQKMITFTPEAGADYEMEINTIQEGGCGIRVTKVEKKSGNVSATPIPISLCG